MPVRHREFGDDLASPQPKRCRHCDESRSSCGEGGGSEGSERASWRVTLDHDLVETLSAIYPEWFKPQPRRSGAASPESPASPHSPHTPSTPSDDTFSSGAEEMAARPAGFSGASEPASPPRSSPPKVVVDDSPLQPAMGKHKESLKVKLMMRRPINQLVAQGIMPPLKTPPAYFEQCKQLERAKTGDLLKAKIQRRPDRQELERRHILEQESHVDPSLAEKQRMLKKARLADQLNDQLSHRPGPLELIKKNILHTEETIETAVKSGVLAFKATSEGASGRPQHPSSYCGPPEEVSPSPSPPSTLSPCSAASPPQHPAPGKDKNRKKSKQKQQPKARFKFHEYKGPPNAQKPSPPPGSIETPYELLLQQQQLLLQLSLPPSPAASVASATSIASDCSELAPPPPPPPPVTPGVPQRIEDMKVSDLRAECKRRNLRVSGPKPQLIDRLRPFLVEKHEEPPRSPASVTSVASLPSVASFASMASPDPKIEIPEDIVQSQRRQIEELERKLEASRQLLESVRREAAGAAASDQSRRLLQAHICVSQLRAQLDALQQPPPPPYVLATAAAAADPPDTINKLVQLFTVSPPDAQPETPPKANPAYILNGVKVVPITILPPHYEGRPAPVPPPPPPPPPPPLHDRTEDSQIMDDVLEILVENGELPPSAVSEPAAASLETYLPDAEPFESEGVLGSARLGDALVAGDLQRELDDIQDDIMAHADLHLPAEGATHPRPGVDDIDADLGVDLLSDDGFRDFGGSDDTTDHDEFFRSLLSGERIERPPVAMDVADDTTERMDVPALTNGDLLGHSRHGFDDMDDLSLPSFQNEDVRHGNFGPFDERPGEFDIKDFVTELGSGVRMDGDGYDYMDTDVIPNHFGRGHVPPCDPLLGGGGPRPALKYYAWDRIEFDAT